MVRRSNLRTDPFRLIHPPKKRLGDENNLGMAHYINSLGPFAWGIETQTSRLNPLAPGFAS